MSKGNGRTTGLSRWSTLLLAAALTACGGGEPKQDAAQPPDAAAPQPGTTAPAPLQASGAAWAPEQLEELAAPVALFPDPVLAQVLLASTNPQEVLDAGNWLLQNQALEAKALDEAATRVGFTPPTRALIQFPQVIDMMCLEIGWTTNLGQAFVDDQDGLLDAVQRLRLQAMEVGNLQSSDQMKVETTTQDGEEVVLLSSPSPEVVYVPQYDPVAAYAPPPATTTTAPATTTTTEKGYSGGEMVATGLLAFGAGLLVAEVFDDDDDDWYHHHNYYGHGGMPYYPPYPYRPVYGGGYYPSNGYNRPPNYGGNWGNNNTIIINNNNNYWNRYDGNRVTTQNRAAQSPITTAKKNRPELQALNAEAKKGPKRAAPATPEAWKGQSGYAGAGKKDTPSRVASAKPGVATRDAAKPAPKVQGSYAGAKDRAGPATAPTAKPYNVPSTRPAAAKPATAGARDRGYTPPAAKPVAKPAAQPGQTPAARPAAKPTAVSDAGRQGTSTKAASQRGKQSMPKGVPPKARSGGSKQKAAR